MEEVQCCLIGLSCSWTSSLHPGAAGHVQQPVPPPSISSELRNALHPTEYSLIMDVLPLGGLYSQLARFSSDVLAGRHDGYLASAVGLAVRDLLTCYETEVRTIFDVSSLERLSTVYSEPMRLLLRMTHHALEPEVLVLLCDQFVATLDIAPEFRQMIGERVSASVAFCIAHVIAYGVLPEGRKRDFFVTTSSTAGEDDDGTIDGVATLQPSSSRAKSVFVVNKRLLVSGVTSDVAHSAAVAGVERHNLQRQLDASGSTTLKDGRRMQDVSKAVFASIANASLYRGGRLVVEELVVRVEAARALWSRALWALVGETADLEGTMVWLRDAFLGHRGDVWGTFAERSFSSLCSGLSFSKRGVLSARIEFYSSRGAGSTTRAVQDAFRASLRAVGLEDSPFGEHVRLGMETCASPPAGGDSSSVPSLDDAAETILSRIECMFLSIDMSAGSQLVVPAQALDQYHNFLSFHLTTRYALHALHLSRKLLHDVLLHLDRTLAALQSSTTSVLSSSASTSSYVLSMKQLVSRTVVVHHFLTFVLTTVGHYFQADVIESLFHPFAKDLRHRTESVDEAKQKHRKFLLDVADAIFTFDDHNVLNTSLRAASRAAFLLYGFVCRTDSTLADGGGPNTRIPAEAISAIARLERTQRELVIAFASHLSGSSRPCERSLWARLDFNRYFSRMWGTKEPAASSGESSRQRSGSKAVKGTPLSLGSLVAPGSVASAAVGVVASSRLQTTAIPSSGGPTASGGGVSHSSDSFPRPPPREGF